LEATLCNGLAGRGLADDRADAGGEVANDIGRSGKSGAHRHRDASSEKEHTPANGHSNYPFSFDWLAIFSPSFEYFRIKNMFREQRN
jgi:hypothetical protein